MVPKYMKHLCVLFGLVLCMTQPLFADSKLAFQAADVPKTVLERQVGQVVDLRLKSGEKLAGKVEKVGDQMVHLTQLTGMEFFEAAVAISEISAVVVRNK